MLLALAMLLRVCVLLLSVEVSGLVHAGLDVLEALRGESSAHAEQCDDDCGDECPPGCPNCHCWRGATSPDPDVAAVVVDVPALPCASVAQVSVVPCAAEAPPGADPSSIYRPPRLLAAL